MVLGSLGDFKGQASLIAEKGRGKANSWEVQDEVSIVQVFGKECSNEDYAGTITSPVFIERKFEKVNHCLVYSNDPTSLNHITI